MESLPAAVGALIHQRDALLLIIEARAKRWASKLSRVRELPHRLFSPASNASISPLHHRAADARIPRHRIF